MVRTVFISDLHMSTSQNKLSALGTHDYWWLSQTEIVTFANFLKYLQTDETVKEIVLLGDIMDNWVFPIDVVPPTFTEIIGDNANDPIVIELRNISRNPNIKIIYIPGNHDMSVTKKDIDALFNTENKTLITNPPEKMHFGATHSDEGLYSGTRTVAAHGSAFCLFNAQDRRNGGSEKLPLGYYITRIEATRQARTGNSRRHILQDTMDTIEAIAHQEKLPRFVFDAVADEADLKDDIAIILPNNKSITIGEVKKKYEPLFDNWKEDGGRFKAIGAIAAELGDLQHIANTIVKDGGNQIVIFGHTHKHKLHQGLFSLWNGIYANCGSWCEDKEDKTFVVTEKIGDAQLVSLMSWNGTTVNTIDTKSV